MSEREKIVEVMARAICAGQGLDWKDQFSIYSSNGDPLAHEAFRHDARAALLALEAAGVRLVPVSVTPQMAWNLESNFAEPLPASEIHAANWQEAYSAMLTASPYAPDLP